MRFVWLALFAVLLNALAPTVSHALAASRPTIPVDVCSVDGGAPFAAAAALLMQDEHAGMGLTGDCGYCLTHAGSHGLPPPVHVPFALMHGSAPRLFLFQHAPRPPAVWIAAVPRGPPAFA
jgi:hypothetical protein